MIRRRMMPARARRPLLVTTALLCFAAAAALTPSDVRSQLTDRQPASVAERPPPVEAPLAPVVPSGDAFAPRANVDEDAHLQPDALLPRLPRTGSLPPRTAPVTRVTAIATGSQPTAIVERDGVARVITVGDALDGSAVAAIGDDAIRLANGRRLSLVPAVPTP